jgi:hypothetical protein
MQANTATAPVNADIELTSQLLAAGFRLSVPSGLTVPLQPLDQVCCRRLGCPACDRVAMNYRPHFKGSRDRAVAR